MKKIFTIVFSVLAAAGLVSCSILEENPSTSLSETTVYTSESGLEAAINGCYAGMKTDALYQGNMNEFLHNCSGIIHWKGNRLTNEMWNWALCFTQYSQMKYTGDQYTHLYTDINRINKILDQLPGSPVAADFKTEIEGEAKFLRAFNYYTLVRVYGDIPLNLNSAASISDASKPRSAYYKVYNQIVNDLKDAQTKMRTPARVSEVSGEASRPNRWAATAMLASVYMQIGSILDSPDDQFFDRTKDAALIAEGKDPRSPDFSAIGINSASDAWTLCLEAAEKVINEGPYSLVPNYADLYKWTNPEDFQLPERIFVLTSTPQVSTGTYTAVRSLPEFPEGTRNKSTSNGNWGRWRPSRWIFQKWCETYPGNKGTRNSADIYVSSSDPRLDVSFIYGSYVRQDKNSDQSCYPNSSTIYSHSNYVLPYFKKYLDPLYDGNAGYADMYILRFAEMYLIAAEACASLSSGPGDAKWNKAFEYMEVIHKRARGEMSTAAVQSAEPKWETDRFDNTKDLITAIMFERSYEMIGEGHEFFDTHRRGATWLSENIAQPKNAFLKLKEQGDVNTSGDEVADGGYTTYYYGKNFQYPTDVQELRKSIVVSFPYSELLYNPAIDMNKDVNDFYWK